MVRGAIEKGFDKRSDDSESHTLASMAIRIALEDAELFHDGTKAFISLRTSAGGRKNFFLGSESSHHFIRARFYSQFKRSLSIQALTEAIGTLTAHALFTGPKYEVAVRVARADEVIYVDLGRDDGLVVRIDASGWKTTFDTPARFWRPGGFGELPEPIHGGKINKLASILQIEAEAWVLVLAFIISAMRPGGPYFCLLVDGQQGSGKSILCTTIKRIIDPNVVERLQLPSTEDQLFIQASGCHLLVFDNASGMRNDMSDAFCLLETGGAIAKRKLYTDGDVHFIHQCKPFVMNGIGDYVHRPDLLDRSILLSLPTMEEGSRKTERELFDQVSSALPGILGSLYSLISVALRYERSVEAPRAIRMADAAAWISAAERGTDFPKGTFLEAIVQSQTNSVVDRIRENSLVLWLEAIIADGPYEGGVGHLHELLMIRNDRPDRSFPRTPAHLSNQLQRLRPAMAKAGLFVELERRGRDGRTVRIWRKGQEGMKPKPRLKQPWERW
jgi:hypothetical protein